MPLSKVKPGIDDNSDATAITIDSSEQVGIGEDSPLGTLHVRTSDASITSVNANADDLIVESNGNTGMSICSSTSGEGNINFIDSGDTNIGRIQYTHSDNKMQFRVNDSVRAAIDSSGNFGIGTSSPAVALHVQAGSGQIRLHEGNAADNKYGEIEVSNGKLILHSDKSNVESNSTMQFHLDNSEKMRIDSGGNVGINATSGGARLHVEDETNDQVAFFHNTNSGFSSTNVQISTSRNTTGGAYNHLACSIHGVATKFIVYDGGQVVNSTNSYGQISDQRLKENIADASSQWDDIKALQVRNFNFIGDDLTQIGVVAQEVETAGMNGLIQEAAWYDAASNPDSEVRKTVKYSVLYMKAVKALQEAMTRIETLETKVAALEAGE